RIAGRLLAPKSLRRAGFPVLHRSRSIMRRPQLERFLIATAVVIAIIVYGSLYPFVFRQPVYGIGPARTLLESWRDKPSRGDFIANMLFYMPLGFFAILAIGNRIGGLLRIALVVASGRGLCTLIEMGKQYHT